MSDKPRRPTRRNRLLVAAAVALVALPLALTGYRLAKRHWLLVDGHWRLTRQAGEVLLTTDMVNPTPDDFADIALFPEATRLRLPLAIPPRILRRLGPRLPLVRSISFFGRAPDPAVFEALAGWSPLRRVELSDTGLDTSMLDALATLPQLEELVLIRPDLPDDRWTKALSHSLAKFRSLKEFEVSGVVFDADAVGPLAELPNLGRLRVEGHRMLGLEWKALAASESLRHVEGRFLDSRVFDAFAKAGRLESLSVEWPDTFASFPPLPLEYAESVARIPSLRRLELKEGLRFRRVAREAFREARPDVVLVEPPSRPDVIE